MMRQVHIVADTFSRTRKRLAKNPSFDEWFFNKRYTDVLPKYFMWWYFANMALYIVFIVVLVVYYFLRMHHNRPFIYRVGEKVESPKTLHLFHYLL